MLVSQASSKLRAREGVFISYARSDGSAIAAELRERLQLEEIPLWQDVVGMEGGENWWLQVTNALNHVEYMALVITPNALKSETVKKEWRYAREQGVCIYPINGATNLNFAEFPRWLQKKHLYDFSDDVQWQKFLNDLETHCEVPRVPVMVEDVSDFVPRPKEYQQLLANLLNPKDDTPVAITAALRGAGGYGKTTLAKALCNDEAVQAAFDDGILWVTLGENPGDLTARVADLIETLSGERPGFTDVNVAAVRLRQILTGRDVLMVVDDLWNPAHLSPFILGTGACLITTRIVDTLPPNTKRVTVDAMRREEAVALLGADLSEITNAQLTDLSARLGEWPLLLKLVNGVLRHRVNILGQDSVGALAWVDKALAHRGLTAFDAHNAQSRDQAVQRTLAVSLDQLDHTEAERYRELAVFPDDIEIPLSALGKLWSKSGFDEFETEALCERLDRLSLLQRFDPMQRVITLHDVVRNYLINEVGDRLPALHTTLLNAHEPVLSVQSSSEIAPCVWAELSSTERYLWDKLIYHLNAAERSDELLDTVKDLRYLAAKTVARNAVTVERDLLDAERICASDSLLPLLRRRFVQSGYILDQCATRKDAETTLFSRLLHERELKSLTDRWAMQLSRPFIKALHALPDLPNPFLVRTVSAHTNCVNGIAISNDGGLMVSVSDDENVKLWEVISGELVQKLSGHNERIDACAISPDGKTLVSTSETGRVKVWSVPSGKLRQTLQNDAATSYAGYLIVSQLGDGKRVVRQVDRKKFDRKQLYPVQIRACAIDNDGHIIVAAALKNTVHVWRLRNGEVMSTFQLPASVRAVAMNRDGTRLLSGSDDGIVNLWDAFSGHLRRQLFGHQAAITACAISDDGHLIMSGSEDGAVIVWEAPTGRLLHTLSSYGSEVRACALSGDGRTLISGSVDGALKVWNVHGEDPISVHTSPTFTVNGCAISHDGETAVAASEDGGLNVWNVTTGLLSRRLFGHKSSANACAISHNPVLLASVSDDETIKVWDLATGTLTRSLSGHTGSINACAINRDGTIVISGGDDETAIVWRVSSGEVIFTLRGHSDWLTGCAITPNGEVIASASADGTVKIWNGNNGELLQTLPGLAIWLNGCGISSDGSTLVSASADGRLKIWDVNTGTQILTLIGHSAAASSCAITPDGQLVLSTSIDGTIKTWNAKTGECLSTLHVDGPLYSCAIRGDGDLLVTGGARGLYFLRYVA